MSYVVNLSFRFVIIQIIRRSNFLISSAFSIKVCITFIVLDDQILQFLPLPLLQLDQIQSLIMVPFSRVLIIFP